MSSAQTSLEPIPVQVAWSSPKCNPPISAIRCTDGSWYLAMLGSTGTWVFAWCFNEEGQAIGGRALIDGVGTLRVGGDQTVQLWGLNQSQIVFMDIGNLASAFGSPAALVAHPVSLALYPGAIPDEIINSKRCDDGNWYIATFLKGGSDPNRQGVWVFRWQNGNPGQPLFQGPLTPGHGWLEVGADNTAQLWVLQQSAQGANEILVMDMGSLSTAAEPAAGPFSGKAITVDLPLDPGAELYDFVSAIRCDDGSWYVAVFVVNHNNTARQGTWVFKWSNNGQPGTPVTNGPVLANAATLALGENNTVQLWGVGGADGPPIMFANIGPCS